MSRAPQRARGTDTVPTFPNHDPNPYPNPNTNPNLNPNPDPNPNPNLSPNPDSNPNPTSHPTPLELWWAWPAEPAPHRYGSEIVLNLSRDCHEITP